MVKLQQALKISEWMFFVLMVALFFIIISPLLPTKKFLASYSVITGSMEPSVPVGTLALVTPIPPNDLKTGDVIAFPEPNNPKIIVLHRIVEIQQLGNMTQFRTKGDNNNSADNWLITPSTVKGKMVYGIPGIGYPIKFAQTQVGFIAIIAIPATWLIFLQLKSIWEGIQEEWVKRVTVKG